MGKATFQRERDVAVAAVREAAGLCQAVQDELKSGVLEKEDRSPVTVADFGSQALICRTLGEAFPEDPVIGEEGSDALRTPENEALLQRVVRRVQAVESEAEAGTVCRWIDAGQARSYSERFWTLDPIDGTRGFVRGDQYAIALALVVEGEVQVAALACPNLPADLRDVEGEVDNGRGSIFAAVRGEGAVQLPLEEDESEPVRVSKLSETAPARFCESVESSHSSHDDAVQVAEKLGMTADSLRVDSQAKYAVVARGDADIYLRLPTGAYVENIWDHAAGSLLVSEAGGAVTDINGDPLEFNHGHRLEVNRGIVASNGRLHGDVLEAIAAVRVS